MRQAETALPGGIGRVLRHQCLGNPQRGGEGLARLGQRAEIEADLPQPLLRDREIALIRQPIRRGGGDSGNHCQRRVVQRAGPGHVAGKPRDVAQTVLRHPNRTLPGNILGRGGAAGLGRRQALPKRLAGADKIAGGHQQAAQLIGDQPKLVRRLAAQRLRLGKQRGGAAVIGNRQITAQIGLGGAGVETVGFGLGPAS